MSKKLTKSQSAYIYWRARDTNPTQSVLKSYNVNSANSAGVLANRLEKVVKIQNAIENEKVRTCEGRPITDEWVLNSLRNIAENGKVEANKLRAMELLGKTRRMFIERIEQDGAKTIIVNYGTSPLPPKVPVEAKETSDEGEGVGGGE